MCSLVQVVLCDAGLSDISKFYCWSDPTPRTTCTASDPAACSFSYSWAVTPALLMAAPPLAQAGAVLTINGTNLEDVTRVVLSAAWGSTECPLVYENATHLMCSVPSLPAGSYEVRGCQCRHSTLAERTGYACTNCTALHPLAQHTRTIPPALCTTGLTEQHQLAHISVLFVLHRCGHRRSWGSGACPWMPLCVLCMRPSWSLWRAPLAASWVAVGSTSAPPRMCSTTLTPTRTG